MKTLSRLRWGVLLFIASGLTAWGSGRQTHEPPAGIRFVKGSWQDVLAEAKRQNKPVFLDIYTTWCPPCKRMAREALPSPAIGARFNVHFINYQLDAEQGEGISVARRYSVSSYPTSLYIAPNGDLIHRSVGYTGIKGMLDQVDIVLDMPRLRTTVVKGDKDYANGRRDPNFLKKYLHLCQTHNRPIQAILDAYIDALPAAERSTDEAVTFVAQTIQSSTTKAFDYLLTNPVAPVTQQALTTSIQTARLRALTNDFNQACTTQDEALLEKVITNSQRSRTWEIALPGEPGVESPEIARDYRLAFYKQTGNFLKYRSIADSIAQGHLMNLSDSNLHRLDSVETAHRQAMMDTDSPNPSPEPAAPKTPDRRPVSWKVARLLHELADTYQSQSTSPADWQRALAWAERSTQLKYSPAYLTTYAWLLKKLGRTVEAIDTQQEAIREATKAGLDPSEYEKHLAQMSQL